jgi:selenocysteine-specific translation elongation factor
MFISDVFKSMSLGVTVCGKVESGAIMPKDRVLVMPLNETVLSHIQI